MYPFPIYFLTWKLDTWLFWDFLDDILGKNKKIASFWNVQHVWPFSLLGGWFIVFNAIFSDISVIILLGEYIFCNLINRRNSYYVAINQVTVPGTVRIIKHKHAIKLFITLVIGDEDACGAPKLLLKDVSFIKLQLFVVLNDMSVWLLNKLVEKFGIPQLVLQREIWRVALPSVRSIQRQRSNWSPTYILHLFHLEDTSLLFLFISESVKVRFLPRVDSFSFAQEPHVVYCF